MKVEKCIWKNCNWLNITSLPLWQRSPLKGYCDTLSITICSRTDWFERSISESGARASYTSFSQASTHGPRAMSLDLEKQQLPSMPGSGPPSISSTEPVRPKRTTRHAFPCQTDTRIMVVWLESFEDCTHFPIGKTPDFRISSCVLRKRNKN